MLTLVFGTQPICLTINKWTCGKSIGILLTPNQKNMDICYGRKRGHLDANGNRGMCMCIINL